MQVLSTEGGGWGWSSRKEANATHLDTYTVEIKPGTCEETVLTPLHLCAAISEFQKC